MYEGGGAVGGGLDGTIGTGGQSSSGDVMMSSLQSKNKNKKKGFRHALNAPVPRKIIFSDDPTAQNQQTEPEPRYSGTCAETTSSPSPAPARLIPPSEKQDKGELPPGMFVTSVDVEEGMWGHKRKRKQQDEEEKLEEWLGENSWFDVAPKAAGAAVSIAGVGVGNVDQNMDVDVGHWQELEVKEGGFDWDRAENAWDQFAEVQRVEQLCVGGLVGWKVCVHCLTLIDYYYFIRFSLSLRFHTPY